MIYEEQIPRSEGVCRGCGASAAWRILFAIGPRISPEKVDLCNRCIVELAAITNQRALLAKTRIGLELKG